MAAVNPAKLAEILDDLDVNNVLQAPGHSTARTMVDAMVEKAPNLLAAYVNRGNAFRLAEAELEGVEFSSVLGETEIDKKGRELGEVIDRLMENIGMPGDSLLKELLTEAHSTTSGSRCSGEFAVRATEKEDK